MRTTILRLLTLTFLIVMQGSMLTHLLPLEWGASIPHIWLGLTSIWLARSPDISSVGWLVGGAALYELLYLPSFGVLIVAAIAASVLGLQLVPRLVTGSGYRSFLVLILFLASIFTILSAGIYMGASVIMPSLPELTWSLSLCLQLLISICASALAALVFYWMHTLYDRSVPNTVR